MKRGAWEKFVKARDAYRATCEELERGLPQLQRCQQKLVDGRASGKADGLAYRVETPIVYNTALDDVTSRDKIKLILVADNPGRREQAAENRRYLVGPSGKIAEKFFRENPSPGIDFRRNAIILNKTPIHTPRTAELRELCRLGGPAVEKSLAESQLLMARLLLDFHRALNDAHIWIIGYSEMKKGGIFEAYTQALCSLYAEKSASALAKNVFVFRHFSMNQFTIDLHKQAVPDKSLAENLERIGTAYRQRILDWSI
jgi:hypothetical protein